MASRWLWPLLGILALSMVPVALPVRYLNLLTEFLILGLFTMSLNIIMGYTGMVSFGQAAFFGIGAYVSGMILLKFNLPLPLAAFSGALASVAISLPIGFFCTRATRMYFGMLTIAFAQMIYAIVFKWYSLTGGSDGIAGIPRSSLWFGMGDLSSRVAYYYFVFAVMIFSLFIFVKIINSPFGKTLRAIKENGKKVESLGINTRIFKLTSFVIGAFFAGVAGSLLASFHGFASPELLFLDYSGNCVLMLILGGVGTVLGPFVGAIIFVLLHEELSLLTENYLIFVGVIFIFAVLFFPDGVVGSLRALRRGKE
jgi:branched-chain amino acid transport system permease protein